MHACCDAFSQIGVDLHSLGEAERAVAIQKVLEGRTATSVVEWLRGVGVPAVQLSSLASLRERHASPVTSFGRGRAEEGSNGARCLLAPWHLMQSWALGLESS